MPSIAVKSYSIGDKPEKQKLTEVQVGLCRAQQYFLIKKIYADGKFYSV